MSAATPPEQAPPDGSVLCPRCSAGFACGVDSGACWCASVAVNEMTRKDLASFYNGCLCPDCLHHIEDNRPRPMGLLAFMKKNLRRRRG